MALGTSRPSRLVSYRPASTSQPNDDGRQILKVITQSHKSSKVAIDSPTRIDHDTNEEVGSVPSELRSSRSPNDAQNVWKHATGEVLSNTHHTPTLHILALNYRLFLPTSRHPAKCFRELNPQTEGSMIESRVLIAMVHERHQPPDWFSAIHHVQRHNLKTLPSSNVKPSQSIASGPTYHGATTPSLSSTAPQHGLYNTLPCSTTLTHLTALEPMTD